MWLQAKANFFDQLKVLARKLLKQEQLQDCGSPALLWQTICTCDQILSSLDLSQKDHWACPSVLIPSRIPQPDSLFAQFIHALACLFAIRVLLFIFWIESDMLNQAPAAICFEVSPDKHPSNPVVDFTT